MNVIRVKKKAWTKTLALVTKLAKVTNVNKSTISFNVVLFTITDLYTHLMILSQR